MKSAARIYLLCSLGLFMLFMTFALQVIPWFEWSDGSEHAAAVRELQHSLTKPLNPHLVLPGTTSPRYVPSIIAMALAQRLAGCDIFPLLGFCSLFSWVMLAAGIYVFAREYFRDEYQPLYTLLSLLFLWGRGWDGANSIMFSSLVYNAYYPSVISLILMFFALAALIRFMRGGSLRAFIACALISMLVFLNHPLTGFLLFFISLLMLVAEGGLTKGSLILFTLSLAMALVAAALWPYYSFFTGVIFMAGGKGGQFWDYQAGYNLHYSGHLMRIGPGLLGFLAIAYFGARKQYRFIVLGFLASLLLYVVGYFLKIILAERLIFVCMFFGQLAFSRMLKYSLHGFPEGISATGRRAVRLMCVAALGVGCVWQICLAGRMYLPEYIEWRPRLRVKAYQRPLQHYLSLRQFLKRGDIVMTDVFTSWVLPCITDVKVISLFHNSPFIEENAERLADTRTFFTSPAARESLLRKYNISHVLVNKKKTAGGAKQSDDATSYVPFPDARLLGDLSRLGRVIVDDEYFFLVEVGNPSGRHSIDLFP